MKHNIKSLSLLDFLKMVPTRKAKIEAAPATAVPKISSYKANEIAEALHPERQYLKVAEIVVHDKDVKSFTLVPNEEKGAKTLAYFSAGQYLSVSLTVGKAVLTRPYSISSSPKDSLKGKYVLTIKRVDGGLATNYILDNWTVGTEVITSGPEGVFTYEPLRDAKQIIGLAGGSGITPFLSLANAIADGDEDASLTLIYGSKTLSDILFKAEFEEIAKKCNRFKVVNVLSCEEAENCEYGFITAELIKKYAPKGKDYSIFMCGPQAMYNFVDKEIEKLGLRQKFIRHEVFGEYRNPANDADYPKIENTKFKLTVTICGESKTMECDANDTLLNTLEHNGIAAPARCRSGICGWCRAKLTSGEVYIPKSVDGRRLADFQYGYIHPCCTFPISDVSIIVSPAVKRTGLIITF